MRNLTQLTALVLTCTALLAVPALVKAQVTAGHTLNYDAGLDATPGNSVWEDLNGTTGFNWCGANVTHNAAPTTGLTGLTGSYIFPTSASNNAADKGTMATYSNISAGEGPTDDPASFELWFRPANLSGGNQVLWETGGSGQGVSFTIQGGNTLRFELQQNSTNELILTTPLNGLEGEFIQVLGTYDRNNPGTTDTLRLYVNGQEITSSPTTATGVNDWAGGDGSGIGGQSGAANTTGATGGSAGLNFNTFDGEIAIHRLYESVLTSTQVVDNFAAIAGEKDVHWDNGSVDTSGPVTAPYTNATDLWSERTNWRVNSTPGTQTTAPNDVRPSIIDRVNISLNDTETLDVPARIAAGDNFEVSSVRIGGNFGLGTGGDGILNVDGGTLTVSGQGLGSGIAMGFSNRDGKLNISNGALVDITAGDLLVGVENGNAGDVSEVNVTGASTLNVAGSFLIGGNQNTNADANTRGTVVIGNGADSPVVNVSGGNTEVAHGGIGRFTLNSGEFNQLASNFVLAQTRNTGSTSNTDAIVDVNGGTLTIAGTGQLNMNGGVSVFNHNGGDVIVGGDMQMATANDTTSNATYNLDAGAGSLSIGGDLFVGRDRVAELNFESGGFSIGGTIYVGGFDNTTANNRPNADGTINIGVLGGNPTMNTGQFEVGRHNLGLVNQDNGTVNVNSGNLVLGQLSNADGTYDISGGTLNVANDLNNNSGDATLNISGTGIVNVAGDVNLSNANSGGTTANISGGELNVEGNFGYRSNGNDVVNQSGGNVKIEGALNMGGTGTQDYNLQGGVLSFADTSIGTQQPNPADSNNASSININSAGDFSFTGGQLENVSDINAGNGPFEQDGGRFVIGVDGVDNIDVSPTTIRAQTTITGDYNQNDGSLVVDIFGPGSHGSNGEAGSSLMIDPLDPSLDSDILEVTGIANLDGTLEVDLNEYEPNPFSWYDVLVAAEINILSGFEVDGVNLFRVIDDPTNAGRQILQVAVPEPASLALWSMLGLALAGFGYRRWRNRK